MNENKDYEKTDTDSKKKENSLIHVAEEYAEIVSKAIMTFADDSEEDDIEKLKQ